MSLSIKKKGKKERDVESKNEIIAPVDQGPNKISIGSRQPVHF